MALVTQAEAARILGISRQAVSIAINAGRLETQLDSEGKKMLDGSTLAAEYRKKTQARKASPKRRALQASEPKARMGKTQEYIPDYDESRARTEHLKAELLELDRKQKEGLLVPAADVEAKWLEIVTLARTKTLGIPSKAKQRIPDLDVGAMATLEDIVRETLEDLASEAGE
jgi:hypothetical protein